MSTITLHPPHPRTDIYNKWNMCRLYSISQSFLPFFSLFLFVILISLRSCLPSPFTNYALMDTPDKYVQVLICISVLPCLLPSIPFSPSASHPTYFLLFHCGHVYHHPSPMTLSSTHIANRMICAGFNMYLSPSFPSSFRSLLFI